MLRLEIDGHWEPEDFIELLEGIESLYYKIVMDSRSRFYFEWEVYRRDLGSFEDRIKDSNDWLLAEARSRAAGYERIYVKAINYASPGEVDLVGLGKAMEAIERIIGRLIDFIQGRRKRREEDEQAAIQTQIKGIELGKERESLRAMQVQNAREILALRRDFPEHLNETLIPLLVDDQNKIIDRIAQGKLIGVSRPDDKE